ncbi:MAG: ABC transporter permease [Clostridia bacterium]|nr:ABC transporter permease [Clostridia bacterium]NCC43026.1 ABC transporter permease [Clostridia bacterium]
MRQFLNVLKFELNNYFKNKSFMVTTVLLTIAAIGIIVIPGIFMGNDSKGSDGGDGSAVEAEVENLAIWDEKDTITDLEAFSEAMGGGIAWKECKDAEEVRSKVNEGEVEAGFLVEDMLHYTYVVENNSMMDDKDAVFQSALAQVYRMQILNEKGIDAAEMETLYQTMPESTQEILGKDSAKNYAYTYMLVMILYFLLVFYGQMISVSVTTEKSNRAIEILVTSVNSTSLIFGKVLAGAIAGVLQCTIILGSAVVSYQMFRESWNYRLDFLFQIPQSVWIAFVVFGLLGYLLYAFLFGMLGALVSKTEDISKTSMPLLMIYMVSFFIAIFGMTSSSDSMMMRVASFVPFTSSNAMLIRVAMGSVEVWEILISAGLLIGSCVVAGVLAAKIFRFGTLMYGNPIKFSNALKNVLDQSKRV